ncbi:hypothetical protein ACPPVO_35135 [Dactylosporangium sp. McL0621]|uniref:hypothetical protein n=1 Tax=Dactylosporangium sp. McL0621 TaxID=3415678 RepID=UPI003CEEBFCC
MLEPSAQIESILTAVTTQPGAVAGMQAALQRVSEFPSPLAAMLTGIALDPAGRDLAEQLLDAAWADETRRQVTLSASNAQREVIIGSGCHAAVYAAVRVLSGYPKPLVLERGARAGGTFAMTTRPTFYLNSRNQAGGAGLAGDLGASLNYLPGAPLQPGHLSMAEYQTNADLAFVIRLTLAQFADVVTDTNVIAVGDDGPGVEIAIRDREPVFAGRVIDARGVGDPVVQYPAGGSIVTFPQFMQRMAGPWPLRGVRRAAVIGDGDSAKCAVEALLGIAPPPQLAAAALDQLERIDWYAEDLPATCDGWRAAIRGRYQAIGRYLRPDRFGVQRLTITGRRAAAVALPGTALVDGRAYDLVVSCTGNRESSIGGLFLGSFGDYVLDEDGDALAREHDSLPAFRVGPHARLPLTPRERIDGLAAIGENAVSIFRLATKTARLAATLDAPAER